jgi:hypothetical protein
MVTIYVCILSIISDGAINVKILIVSSSAHENCNHFLRNMEVLRNRHICNKDLKYAY